MRTLVACLLVCTVVIAEPVSPVSDDVAKEALAQFKAAYNKADSVEAKQGIIFTLHDVPHPLVLKQCIKLLRNRDPKIRNVAALAIGGQGFDRNAAGEALMKALPKETKNVEVATSIIDALIEVKYLGYWPDIEKETGKDARNPVVNRIFDLLGANRDYRSIPMLLKMYRVAMPKHVKWSTGTVTVDTGAAGNEDNEAAERKFNQQFGAGGSKAKAKATGKANSFDLRNFSSQIKKCTKAITGVEFDNDIDLEDWWVANYMMVAQKSAEMDGLEGKALEKALRRAEKELPGLKREVEEARKKLEEELAKEGNK
jgi:hypothetical protein